MRRYNTEVGYVIEIDRSEYKTLQELQALIDKLDIVWDAKKSDLEWDTLCFCFNDKYQK